MPTEVSRQTVLGPAGETHKTNIFPAGGDLSVPPAFLIMGKTKVTETQTSCDSPQWLKQSHLKGSLLCIQVDTLLSHVSHPPIDLPFNPLSLGDGDLGDRNRAPAQSPGPFPLPRDQPLHSCGRLWLWPWLCPQWKRSKAWKVLLGVGAKPATPSPANFAPDRSQT